MFERFRACWPKINHANYKPLDDTSMSHPMLQMLRSDVVPFLKSFLSSERSYIPREDYKEMIQPCLTVLGCPVNDHDQANSHYCFRVPGAYHMARWMAKVIYCLKIFLFRDEFKLTVSETKNLTEFCVFATHIYVSAWISCPMQSDAPINDLQLLARIDQYSEINKKIATAATKKLQNHLWYLGPELVWLALFSNKVANTEKKMLVEAMIAAGLDASVRGIKFPPANVEQLKRTQLHELISSTTTAALLSIGLIVALLNGIDPENWSDCPHFQQAANVVKCLKVVNDTAECSIALMTSFNKSITKSEAEMQKLIQVVKDNRERIPDSSKASLASAKMATK
ncbi:hypothetical protein Bpfe_007561 [Biomphalaria pfeifferi]|uniref:Uncharacterized protein n=1 Tax=Biomphalaria pfeifferi TaxID=112525 RepID=A0AAD8FGS1_BIOPF|nr:hypothetical protein Bpfe_007561 [Biomphalaria pfeifferi]